MAVPSWQERTRMLVGEEMLGHFRTCTVAVIGVGGVGGYAAEMIARAGIGHMIIMDSDTVSVSNKNRQLLALDSTVGRPKCEVLAERLRDINPELELTVICDYLESGKVADVLGGRKIDFLVDAIDTLAPKLSLIQYCMENGIPLVSSMGAGAKFDATKVRITDISKSFNCPLAYIVRKRLRHMGISRGFKAVFSEELPDRDSIVACEDRNKKSQVGTISYIPAVFGCACAQAAVQHLMSNWRASSRGEDAPSPEMP
ncbi:MAG: tRNA threonylcarbamoyladenosine dehydratase [Bacteroidales bacterium]|nr:tRNA threonylcarbamoyladenosine dehydratase [Bacteroidales bacterium]